MKEYKKAQMIAKNLPTGSYAAGCPAHTHQDYGRVKYPGGPYNVAGCERCEVVK